MRLFLKRSLIANGHTRDVTRIVTCPSIVLVAVDDEEDAQDIAAVVLDVGRDDVVWLRTRTTRLD